ncbi:Zinc finger, CCCH-type,Transcription factor IIS, N-terminal [Cinara cedri]|uniref:Zinc finger, CCCH-type,Transcription factor IIS, N-terminal n=1 Tax=Cinara cedri TaxID=506608 RepID=A0A5E4N6M9_9HEMI|nr:Zinc finger, CCCH-type,Transcription factor IIS, N-terminal [Cinara cedri]
MAPIDPIQSLNNLQRFLNKNTGGLKDPQAAMQISQFMNAGGWNLTNEWLKTAVENENITLIQDILQIFDIFSVTVSTLKSNEGPKLINKLSETHIDEEVKIIAQHLVGKWSKLVKVEDWETMISSKKSQLKQEMLKERKKYCQEDKIKEGKHTNNTVCNPFLRIIEEMAEFKSNTDKQIENENRNTYNKRKQNASTFQSTILIEQAPLSSLCTGSRVQSNKTKNCTPSSSLNNLKRSLPSPLDSPNKKKVKIASLDWETQSTTIEERDIFLNAMSNVLKSAPKVIKKQEPESETVKKVTKHTFPVSTMSTPQLTTKTKLPSPLRSLVSSSTLIMDCDSSIPNRNVDEQQEEPMIESSPTLEFQENDVFDELDKLLCSIAEEENMKNARFPADSMKPQIAWRNLDDSLLVEIPEKPYGEEIIPGSGSKEKKKYEEMHPPMVNFSKSYNFARYLIYDTPEEPNQMEVVPYFEPLNIPLKDMSGDKPTTYCYDDIPWPDPKGEQPPPIEFTYQYNNIVLMQQQMLLRYYGNQMNSVLSTYNDMTRMVLPQSQLKLTTNNRPYVERDGPNYRYGKNYDSYQKKPERFPYDNRDGLSSHRDGLSSHRDDDDSYGYYRGKMEQRYKYGNRDDLSSHRAGNRSYYYREKMEQKYQYSQRDHPFSYRGGNNYGSNHGYSKYQQDNKDKSVSGELRNRRVRILCKFYAKGNCRNYNCAFLHEI